MQRKWLELNGDSMLDIGTFSTPDEVKTFTKARMNEQPNINI